MITNLNEIKHLLNEILNIRDPDGQKLEFDIFLNKIKGQKIHFLNLKKHLNFCDGWGRSYNCGVHHISYNSISIFRRFGADKIIFTFRDIIKDSNKSGVYNQELYKFYSSHNKYTHTL